jgi:hypothetical protein
MTNKLLGEHAAKQIGEYGLIATAYHEAGHAIVGIHNFWYVSNVEILNKPRFDEGQTLYHDYDVNLVENNDLIRAFLLFDLQSTAAGLEAEKAYYKDITGSDRFPMHLKIGSSDDTAFISSQIRKYKLALPGNPTNLLKRRIRRETNAILMEHWESVRLVAHQLYKRKSLSFEELKFILTRKSDQKDFWKDRFSKIAIIHSDPTPDEHTVRKLIR